MAQLTIGQATSLAARALQNAGAGDAMTNSTARALVLAESQGLASHGLSRVPQYAAHLRNRRADGQAIATLVQRKGAALLVDARQGMAFPACDLALTEAIASAKEFGVCFVGVTNSHHAGV